MNKLLRTGPEPQICRHGIDLQVDSCSDCAVERDLADYDALQDHHADLKLRCERLELSLQRCKDHLHSLRANAKMEEDPELLLIELEATELLTSKLGDWCTLGTIHTGSGELLVCDPDYPGAGVSFDPGPVTGLYQVQARKDADGCLVEVRIIL